MSKTNEINNFSDSDSESDNNSVVSKELLKSRSLSSAISSPSSSVSSSNSSRRSRSKSSSSSDEEQQIDNEEYDSKEEKEEEEESNKKRKRRKKSRFCDFIIDEAEVDDELEEDDDWEDEPEIGIVSNEAEELGPTAREIEGQMREANIWETQNEEELEEYLKNKYSNYDTAGKHFGNGGIKMRYEISQQTLLPRVKDPNLWMVKCRMGEEKKTALLLMRKFLTYQDSEEKLQIKSVIAADNVKGFIYIEAYKKSHVVAAMENVGNLQMGMKNQQMVPIKEMVDVLRVVKKCPKVESQQWVRIMRGQYKDDIARVDFYDASKNRVYLKLLPRIDYAKIRGALKGTISETNKRKKQSRPLSKPFDLEAIKSIGGDVTRDGDFHIFEGNRYSSQGFLYKYFSTGGIVFDGVKPTLTELELFEERVDENDLQFPTPTNDDETNHQNYLCNGDNVVICQGELSNLQGKIVSIEGNIVTIMPKHHELKDHLEFQASDVKKFFKMGDHVKVLCGRYKGETGTIVRVEDNRAILISDLATHEIEALTKDLQVCIETAKGIHSNGKFELGDLVDLDSTTIGMIVLMERENFHVLNMHGKVVMCRPSSLQKRTLNKFTAALDSSRNNIQRKDVVQVIDGPHSGFTGEIKHLYRNFAFLHSWKYAKNGGNFVCKTKFLQLSGGNKLISNSTTDVVRISSPTRAFSDDDCGKRSFRRGGKTRGSNNFGRGRGGGGRGRFNRGRGFVGKTVKVTRGPYKGHIGIVKDATQLTARIELHAKYETITVSKDHIADVNSNATLSDIKNTVYTDIPIKTPPHYHDGSKTPMPSSGSQTPFIDGSKTPHSFSEWDPSVYPSTSYTPSGY